MEKPPTMKNTGGRPRTWSRALPAVRLPGELYFRLERRLLLIQSKTGMKNLSKFVREAIEKYLDYFDDCDRREAAKKTRRSK